MTLGQRTKLLCQKYGIRPNQRLGQHFLIDQNVLRRIVDAAALSSGDPVLEVGPGFGTLTEALLDAGCQVLAIEQDRRFEPALATLAAVSPGLRYVIGDVMRIDLAGEMERCWFDMPPPPVPLLLRKEGGRSSTNDPDTFQAGVGGVYGSWKVVSNLPYQISSEFLRLILTGLPQQPESATVLLQREVAERIMARPGQMSLLALSVQLYADAKIIAKVSPAAFWPRPEVESAVVHLNTHGLEVPAAVFEAFGVATGKSPLASPLEKGGEGGETAIEVIERQLWRMLRTGFSSKRKQLHHNLASGLGLSPALVKEALARTGVPATARAQELSVEEWWALLQRLVEAGEVSPQPPTGLNRIRP